MQGLELEEYVKDNYYARFQSQISLMQRNPNFGIKNNKVSGP